MARVSNLLSWFFFCMAGVLITVATLAVPENAFAADAGMWCNNYCFAQCDGNLDPNCFPNCRAACIDGYGNCSDCTSTNYSDPTLLADCQAGCTAATVPCPGNATCNNTCTTFPYGKCSNDKEDRCNAIAKTDCQGCFCAGNACSTGCTCN